MIFVVISLSAPERSSEENVQYTGQDKATEYAVTTSKLIDTTILFKEE